jgi:hypothetical protein
VSTEEFTDGHIAGHITIDRLGAPLVNTRTPPEPEMGGVSGAVVYVFGPPESSGHFSATLGLLGT